MDNDDAFDDGRNAGWDAGYDSGRELGRQEAWDAVDALIKHYAKLKGPEINEQRNGMVLAANAIKQLTPI